MKVARRRAPSVRAGARWRAAKGAGPSHGRGPPHRRRQRTVAPLHERRGFATDPGTSDAKGAQGRQGRQRRAINLLAATLRSCPAPHLLPSHRRQAAGAARRAAAPPARPLVHHLLGRRPRAVGGRELLEQAIRFLTDLQHRPRAGSGAGVGGWVTGRLLLRRGQSNQHVRILGSPTATPAGQPAAFCKSAPWLGHAWLHLSPQSQWTAPGPATGLQTSRAPSGCGAGHPASAAGSPPLAGPGRGEGSGSGSGKCEVWSALWGRGRGGTWTAARPALRAASRLSVTAPTAAFQARRGSEGGTESRWKPDGREQRAAASSTTDRGKKGRAEARQGAHLFEDGIVLLAGVAADHAQ